MDRQRAPVEAAAMTDPIPELLVQCPRCELTGHHAFATRLFEVPTVLGQYGERIELLLFGDPPAGTSVIDRTCAFCQHRWTRSL